MWYVHIFVVGLIYVYVYNIYVCDIYVCNICVYIYTHKALHEYVTGVAVFAAKLTSTPVCDTFQNFLCAVHYLWLHRCVVGLTYIVDPRAHG